MKIYINQEEHTLEKTLTVEELIQCLNIDDRGLAVAINNHVVPRLKWSTEAIQEMSQVTLIRATQGG